MIKTTATLAKKIKIGERIRVRLNDGAIDPVVYTVQGTRKGCPVILDNWQAVVVKSWVRVC